MIFPAIWRICGSEELRMLTPAAWQISIPHLSTSAASIQIADYVPATLNPLSAVKQMRHRKRPTTRTFRKIFLLTLPRGRLGITPSYCDRFLLQDMRLLTLLLG
ncbi:hypothetical protein A0H81_01629 [Grifola frondosa]|uniref:Uncharacterized protein n=1 Tax=Grifola frondosa TaxID=5627 RepID=A0A1C7MLA0_GRIFR|nr:hypothetical protein A0H81_01629 [Grifola frondosa]